MEVMGAATDPSPNRDPKQDEPNLDPNPDPNPDPDPLQATGTEDWDEVFGFMFETLSEGC